MKYFIKIITASPLIIIGAGIGFIWTCLEVGFLWGKTSVESLADETKVRK